MASNRLPDSRRSLSYLAKDAADGVARHGAAIGIQQNTQDAIRADWKAHDDASSAYLSARVDALNATKTLNAACADGRKWLLMARDVFKTVFGKKPGKVWRGVGWPEHTTAVPRDDGKLAIIIESSGKYLADHPELEAPSLGLTAARAEALAKALRAARSNRNHKKAERMRTKQERAAAEKKLRRRMRGVIGELGQLLDPQAGHWKSFGLKQPGKPDSPPKVKNTRAKAVGGGRLLVEWDAAARAEYYQIHLMVLGRDTEFALLESPRDRQKMLDGLPVDATVRLKVRAMNETGHSPFGEVVEVVVK
ncbi:MAG: fibronectin type III domain-containing protein [Verrucomicrobia bacterium]|nr:fibronectin type III domain-containing protein [Verrucomicrobiota bacterium]